jgi:hypothetical protein
MTKVMVDSILRNLLSSAKEDFAKVKELGTSLQNE